MFTPEEEKKRKAVLASMPKFGRRRRRHSRKMLEASVRDFFCMLSALYELRRDNPGFNLHPAMIAALKAYRKKLARIPRLALAAEKARLAMLDVLIDATIANHPDGA
jgi:hypothetical protein